MSERDVKDSTVFKENESKNKTRSKRGMDGDDEICDT